MIRVLIAGEGANELGDKLKGDRLEGERATGGGVIEAFMTKVRGGGWQIRDAIRWRDVPKLRANAPGDGDTRTVRVLAQRAAELGCNALVFLRDRDGSQARERAIRDAIKEARRGTVVIAGGVPIEMLECWLLALRKEPSAHADPDCVASLEARHGVPRKRTIAMVQLVRRARLLDASPDARSLWRWLRLVAQGLSVKIPKRWP